MTPTTKEPSSDEDIKKAINKIKKNDDDLWFVEERLDEFRENFFISKKKLEEQTHFSFPCYLTDFQRECVEDFLKETITLTRQDERKKIFDSPTEKEARDSFEDYIIAKERERFKEMIEGMKKVTNKNCLIYEPEICYLCLEKDERMAYNQALQDLLNKLG